MMSLAASQFPLPWLAVAGLLLFLLVFLGMFMWVMRRSGKEEYDTLSRLPLQEENQNG